MPVKSRLLVPVLLLTLLAGCAVRLPEASPYTHLQSPAEPLAESHLLDVGISHLSYKKKPGNIGPQLQAEETIRSAEAIYMPVVLQHTLVQTGNWGEVRVLPDEEHASEVAVSGRIIEASGHTLEMEITVKDVSGRVWYTKRYQEHVGNNVYSDNSIGVNDPFQGLYNRVANDMLYYMRKNLTQTDAETLSEMSDLRFGRRFAPQVYDDYLMEDKKGSLSIIRLPPREDPVHARLLAIRQRDREFHSALQQHYLNYAKQMADTYFEYRKFSYQELKNLHEKQIEARNSMLEGVLWLGVAVALSDYDDLLGNTLTAAAVIQGGSELLKGVNEYSTDSGLLEQIDESFAGDVQAEVLDFNENIIILSGTVEEIYAQWKDILGDMFANDRGL